MNLSLSYPVVSQTLDFSGRALVSLIFFANAFNLIDQKRPQEEMVAFGLPERWVPAMSWAGRIAQIVGGALLVSGYLVPIGCLILAGFLAPATLIAHSFWRYQGEARQPQLANFMKNVAIIGGLVGIAAHGRIL